MGNRLVSSDEVEGNIGAYDGVGWSNTALYGFVAGEELDCRFEGFAAGVVAVGVLL